MNVLIEEFPAYKVMKRGHADWQNAPTFKSGEIIAIKRDGYYDRFKLGSVVSFSLEMGKDPIAAFEKAAEKGQRLWWATKLATCISSLAELKNTIYAVEFGEKISFEGWIFEIQPDYNDNIKLVKIEPDS